MMDRLRSVWPAAPRRVPPRIWSAPSKAEPVEQVWICTSTKPETSSRPMGFRCCVALRRPPPLRAKAAAAIGTPVVVVKAQVKTGGRGKAGGVKVAKSPEEAEARAAEILGLDIKGHVKTVMITEGADIAEEYYFSLLLDRAERRYLAMCSRGGMDIETLAAERPEAWRASRWTLWSASTRPRPMRSSPRPASQALMLPRSLAYYSCSAPCTRRGCDSG